MTSPASSAERIAALRAEAVRGLDASTSSTASVAANNTAAPSAADVEATRAREAAVSALIDALVAEGDAAALAALFDELRPLFSALPKAKTAKLVRGVIEAIAKVPGSEELQVRGWFPFGFGIDRSQSEESMRAPKPNLQKNPPSRSQKKQLRVCREQAAWARAEKRTFLRQRLDARLAGLLLRAGDVAGALRILSALASEVKRLDDKLLLVDVHLLESRAHRALRDLPRSRATLTAARAAAASTYVPPAQQAELDAQSGALHADERDYRTAFSYFYEAFDALAPLSGAAASTSSGAAAEGPGAGAGARAPVAETAAAQLTAQHRRGAAAALKHMLLCKVMMGDAAEVPGLVAAKAGSRFAGRDVDALQAVAAAHAARSLSALDKALSDWREELEGESSSSSSSSSSSVFFPPPKFTRNRLPPALLSPLFSLYSSSLSLPLNTRGRRRERARRRAPRRSFEAQPPQARRALLPRRGLAPRQEARPPRRGGRLQAERDDPRRRRGRDARRGRGLPRGLRRRRREGRVRRGARGRGGAGGGGRRSFREVEEALGGGFVERKG